MKKSLLTCLATLSLSAVANTTFPQHALVGYWLNLNTNNAASMANPTIAATAQAGYNVIPVSFGVVNGTSVSLFNSYNNNGYGVDVNQEQFISDIDQAHTNGAIVTLSLGSGGSTSLWQPDKNNAAALAQNLVTFLAQNHMDGVDFDLEANQYEDATYLNTLITTMKSLASANSGQFPHGFFVTGAPQVTTTSYPTSSDTLIISWNGGVTLDSLLSSTACGGNVCFDALFIQNYNNGDMQQQAGVFGGVAGAYDLALGQLNNDNNNGSTKIIVGLPATGNDGSSTVTWPQAEHDKEILYASGTSQFAGLMVWTASSDYTQTTPWQVIDQLRDQVVPSVNDNNSDKDAANSPDL